MITVANGLSWTNMVLQPFKSLLPMCLLKRRGQNGPASDTIWMVRGPDGEFSVDKSVTILDAIGVAELVRDATVVIGDNITALKWAFVDAVTPGNAHIRASYH